MAVREIRRSERCGDGPHSEHWLGERLPDATADASGGRTIKLLATTKNCDTSAYLAETLAGPAFDPTTQYTITVNPGGSIKVADNTSVAAGPPFPKGDGANDTLWNIENLRFCISNDAVTKACNAFTDLPVAPTAFAAPSPLAFGNVKVGTNTTLSLTVSNVGLTRLNLNAIPSLLNTSNAAFTTIATGTTCTATTQLVRGASCIVRVRFTPTTSAAVTGTIAVTSSNGATLNVPVTGKGATPLATASPASLTFAKQNIGTNSATQNVTLSNSGDAVLAISSIVVSTGSGFSRPAAAREVHAVRPSPRVRVAPSAYASLRRVRA